ALWGRGRWVDLQPLTQGERARLALVALIRAHHRQVRHQVGRVGCLLVGGRLAEWPHRLGFSDRPRPPWVLAVDPGGARRTALEAQLALITDVDITAAPAAEIG